MSGKADPSHTSGGPTAPAGNQGAAHVQAVPPGYPTNIQQTQQPTPAPHPGILSFPGAPQLDPSTASLLMHPQAAAAVAAVAAAAQQMVHAQSGVQHVVHHPTGTSQGQSHPAPIAAQSPAPTPALPNQPAVSASPGHPVQQAASAPGAPLSYHSAVLPHLSGIFGSAPPHARPASAASQQPPQSVGFPQMAPQAAQAGALVQMPSSLSANPAAVAAAAAHVVAAQAAAANVSSGAMANALMVNMQNWKLDQLEAHVQLLRDANQPIPQPVSILLADARRKEEKRTAKRVANRKSACTSRARKKALVEEMTRTNARLKRQALILALLPDLVIAMTVEGVVTFCSAQVERVLKYQLDDLIGVKLSDILIPASKEALLRLTQELVAADQAAAAAAAQAASENQAGGERASLQNESKEDGGNGHGSAQSSNGSGLSSNGAAVVSDQSFPLSVVKVESQQASGGDENSDLSTSNSGGKNTQAASTPNNSVTASPEDDISPQGGDRNDSKVDRSSPKKQGQRQTSSDESFSSSSDVKNLHKANENLSRNVWWHNEKMLSKKAKTGGSKNEHKDDVTGASVTANNADARLSSLQHRPERNSPKKKAKTKVSRYESLEDHSSSSSDSLLAGVEEKKKAQQKTGNENCSDDSGYRESNESAREDTSSSASDSSNGRRIKPLAPTCNICLIRNDMTTIWCEVTSSIRTRSLKEESPDPSVSTPSGRSGQSGSKTLNSKTATKDTTESSSSSSSTRDVIKELLLCLRPIRDGEKLVDESLRFVPSSAREGEAATTSLATTATADFNSGEAAEPKGPMKKRPLVSLDPSRTQSNPPNQEKLGPAKKKTKTENEDDPERSVVESLMLMSNKSTTP